MEGGAQNDPLVRVIFHILLCEEWQACNHKSDCADAQTFSTPLVPRLHRAHPRGCSLHSWDSVIKHCIEHPCQPSEKKAPLPSHAVTPLIRNDKLIDQIDIHEPCKVNHQA